MEGDIGKQSEYTYKIFLKRESENDRGKVKNEGTISTISSTTVTKIPNLDDFLIKAVKCMTLIAELSKLWLLEIKDLQKKKTKEKKRLCKNLLQ